MSAGCEINVAAQLPRTLRRGQPVDFDPDIKRMYNVETTVSVQHELMRGVSVTAAGTTAQYYNMRRRINTGVGLNDFTPFTLYSPIDGSPITYYNVSAAKVAQFTSNLVDQNAPDRTMNTTASSTTSARVCRRASRCSAAA